MKVKSEREVAQSCPTLSDPMDCSLPGSSVHGIFQARKVLEWLVMNNAITEFKNTLEGTNSRITEAEDRISEVEDRIVEINEAERKKELKEMRTTSDTSGTMLNASTFKSQESQKKTKRKNMRKYLRR